MRRSVYRLPGAFAVLIRFPCPPPPPHSPPRACARNEGFARLARVSVRGGWRVAGGGRLWFHGVRRSVSCGVVPSVLAAAVCPRGTMCLSTVWRAQQCHQGTRGAWGALVLCLKI